jgi:hypothetical protein
MRDKIAITGFVIAVILVILSLPASAAWEQGFADEEMVDGAFAHFIYSAIGYGFVGTVIWAVVDNWLKP